MVIEFFLLKACNYLQVKTLNCNAHISINLSRKPDYSINKDASSSISQPRRHEEHEVFTFIFLREPFGYAQDGLRVFAVLLP